MWNGKMVDYYIKKYVEKDEYEPWQIESIRYSLLSIMLELEKWIVLICLFSILGMEYDFLIFAICLLCVRIYHGGLHMKTYTGCLIYSILYFFVAMGLHHMLLKADISIIVYIIIILSEMFVFIIPSPFKENIKLDQIYYPSKDAKRYREGGEPVVWTRDDEAYFISYQLELDGAYLTNMYKHLTSGDVNGTRLEFVVGRDEVYWINCYRIYNIESREEITEPLKSVDDVLKRIKESNYYTIGLTEEGNMTSIELGYISYYSQQEKKMMIIPCWVCDFDITKKMVTGDKEYNESAKVMVIDAVTGQVRY